MLLTMFRYSRMEVASLVSSVVTRDRFTICMCRMPLITPHRTFVLVIFEMRMPVSRVC
jgi:hypothetical protein